MTTFETVEIPFVQVGNRRGLTDRQIAELPWLAEFVARYRDRFEHDPNLNVWIMLESPEPIPWYV
jgi:hypothetical protein